MTGNNENKFVSRRTEALAMVLLTSRPDLTVMSPPANAGIDLIVSIVQKKVHSFNHFGVILKGTSQEIHTARLASKVLSSVYFSKTTSASFTMPVCVFFFSMVGNQGYYAWLQEPATRAGVPRLRHHANLECKPLDLEALQAIVDVVNSYFEGLSKVLVN
jgi:hypothetical protein